MDGISRSKNMKKKTVELLSHYFDDNDFRFTKSQNHEVDIDDLLTVKRSEVGDRKLSKKIKRLISNAKNQCLTSNDLLEKADNNFDKTVAEAYKRYRISLSKNNSLVFSIQPNPII